MKKEISDKIAQAFFEKKVKKKEKNKIPFIAVWISSFVILVLLIFFFLNHHDGKKNIDALRSISFEKPDGPYVLSCDFLKNSSVMVALNIDIAELNLSEFGALKFKARFRGFEFLNDGCLKVGLMNSRQETAYLYVKGIGVHWKTVKLELSEFSNIRDWTHLKKLIFTLEGWNQNVKKGDLLIDEVEFCKS